VSGTDLSYSQVLVGKAMVGLIGLQEILEGLAEEGVMADAPGIGARLVAAVKEFPMSHRLTAADKNGSWPHTFSRESPCPAGHHDE